ncbi:hypothetical protein DFH09DRAFT_1074572 [Mycena vulgaris]|nr:hypothetical protein DFH09DRAFT_1074572 [Mycena vulgaris]
MDASAIRRFTASNVTWPQDRFFILHGGLEMFLHDNLRFKVFLVMTAVFLDAYTTYTVQTLTKVEHNELRIRIHDIVRHMFFASHIRQNEFRTTYGVIPVPGECAWMFHVILVLLNIIGFAGDDAVVATEEVAGMQAPTEGMLAAAQANFFLHAALTTYLADMRLGVPAILDFKDYNRHARVTRHFIHRGDPCSIAPITIVRSHSREAKLAEVINDWRWDMDIAEASAGRGETGMTEAVNLALFAKLSTTVGAALDKLEATGVQGDGEAAEHSGSQRSQRIRSSSPKEAKIFRNAQCFEVEWVVQWVWSVVDGGYRHYIGGYAATGAKMREHVVRLNAGASVSVGLES